MHKSQAKLRAELQVAAEQVRIGASYWHYKNSKDFYKVLHLAITEWDDNICVIYQAQYGEKLIFVRPLESWLEPAEWQGKTVERFTKLS